MTEFMIDYSIENCNNDLEEISGVIIQAVRCWGFNSNKSQVKALMLLSEMSPELPVVDATRFLMGHIDVRIKDLNGTYVLRFTYPEEYDETLIRS